MTDTQAEFIRQCVEAGEYNNASELVCEALRLLKAQKDEHTAKLACLRAELQKGVDDIEAGRYIELNTEEDFRALSEDVRRRGRERLAKELSDFRTEAQ